VEYAHLVPGRRYRVARAFADFDRKVHEVGEEWTYLGTSFLPHDDGRSLFVSYDGEHEWHVRMQDTESEQASILANLASFVVPLED
jgi:hypothetical protein